MTEIWALPATEVLDRFRRRELSPVEYVSAVIERAENENPHINAFGDTYFDEALAQAAIAADRYAAASARPLDGLPVAVKDEADIAGKRTTNGSLLWIDSVPAADEPMVERIKRAGGIIHARTLTPEFSIAFWTSSRLWGITRNPWNRDYDVSGSSGGSGAALAAGMTPLATGSDIGGSIRAPASCCGVVGFKPTYGRIPLPAPYGLDHWCHLGPLARTVGDAALLFDQLVGPDRRDLASIRPAIHIGAPDADVRGLRLALSYDLGDWPVTEVVRLAVSAVAEALRTAGAVVDEVPLTIERALIKRAADAHYASLFAAASKAAIAGREDDANHYTRAWLQSLEDAPTPMEGYETEGEIYRRVGDVLERYDAILCPTASIPALEAGVDYYERSVSIDGADYHAMHDIFLTEVFNATARCPVMSVPAGFSAEGVPIGVQVVGRTFDDPMVFRIGAGIESQRPWPLTAPGFSRS
jgi:aspartyl-tRNA(Asn)/glutamyl-tRNA(Gln) amidotransferase subunit A